MNPFQIRKLTTDGTIGRAFVFMGVIELSIVISNFERASILQLNVRLFVFEMGISFGLWNGFGDT